MENASLIQKLNSKSFSNKHFYQGNGPGLVVLIQYLAAEDSCWPGPYIIHGFGMLS